MLSPDQQTGEVIDKMGEASARAQRLPQIITTSAKFFSSMDNKLFLLSEGRKCIGLLKIGKKNLFIRDSRGAIKEIKPLCLLDFYVHESA